MRDAASSLYEQARWLLRHAPWILSAGAGTAAAMALVTLAMPLVFSSHAFIDVGSILRDPSAQRRIDELNGPLNAGGFRDAFANDPALNTAVTRAWLLYDSATRGVRIRVDATDGESAKRGADRLGQFLVGIYSQIGLKLPVPPRPAEVTTGAGGKLRDLAARLRKDAASPSVPEDRRLRLALAAAFAEQAAEAPAKSATLAGLRFASSSDRVIATALTPAVLVVQAAVDAVAPVEKPVKVDPVVVSLEGNLPNEPSGPNMAVNVAVGFIFGAVAALFILALRDP